MNAAEARALLFQRKLNYQDIMTSFPGLPELDGQLGVLELKGADTSHADKLAQGADGETDKILMMAAMVCMGLVLRDSKERVFSDTDMEGVANFGLTVLTPIGQLIATVSGLDPAALEASKKSSSTPPASDSSTSSPVNSEAGLPSQS